MIFPHNYIQVLYFGRNTPKVMLCSSNGILSGSTQCQFVPILGMFIRECLSDFSAIKLTDKYLVLINKQLTCSLCGDNSENMQISVPHRAFIHWFYFYLFIYLSLAAMVLCCCTQAFSSCGEQGLLFVAVHGLLIMVAFLAVEHRF